jgi:CRP/FNR family cyclic AMP-dependent transcriptional regulator
MLENIVIFSELSQPELEILENHMITRIFRKNTVVINEGDEANTLYIILSGKVKVFLSNADGKEIIINTQGVGEHFGELALLDNAPRSASVMTTEKSSIGAISKIDFVTLLTRHPELALKLIRELTQWVRLLSDNVKTLALMDVYGRVAKTLLAMAESEDGHLIIDNRPTQQDIADRIGASREMVARIMKNLVTGNYISIDGKRLVINEKLPDAY